ncbi:MAG: Fic family protein [Chloroflexi bacterium]|nr:Fic family protein [Chloroflexota bacterium]
MLRRVAQKKEVLDSRRPLPAPALTNLKSYFDVEWTYNSNAIEGSTLTLQETKVVIEHGLTIGGKTLTEHLEAVNHKHAIDFVEALAKEDEPLTEHNIRQIHALILKGIDDEEAGRYRRGQVLISGSSYVPPDAVAVPGLMMDFAKWLNDAGQTLTTLERAALAHFQLVHIHPFSDGNGRTARLLMNLILFRDGYPPTVIRNQDRLAYYTALDQAHGGDTGPFVLMVAEAVEKSLDVFLAA